ncbi:hypothetical protein JCM11491_005643 [Sporobolomyces phaffii]
MTFDRVARSAAAFLRKAIAEGQDVHSNWELSFRFNSSAPTHGGGYSWTSSGQFQLTRITLDPRSDGVHWSPYRDVSDRGPPRSSGGIASLTAVVASTASRIGRSSTSSGRPSSRTSSASDSHGAAAPAAAVPSLQEVVTNTTHDGEYCPPPPHAGCAPSRENPPAPGSTRELHKIYSERWVLQARSMQEIPPAVALQTGREQPYANLTRYSWRWQVPTGEPVSFRREIDALQYDRLEAGYDPTQTRNKVPIIRKVLAATWGWSDTAITVVWSRA